MSDTRTGIIPSHSDVLFYSVPQLSGLGPVLGVERENVQYLIYYYNYSSNLEIQILLG